MKDQPEHRGQKGNLKSLSLCQALYVECLVLSGACAIAILFGVVDGDKGIGGLALLATVGAACLFYDQRTSSECKSDAADDAQRPTGGGVDRDALLDTIVHLRNERDQLLVDRLHLTLRLQEASRELKILRKAARAAAALLGSRALLAHSQVQLVRSGLLEALVTAADVRLRARCRS